MTDLEKYELIHNAEELEDLSQKILMLKDEDGNVEGTLHNAERQSNISLAYHNYSRNALTRQWGIRQQAMYLLYYNL